MNIIDYLPLETERLIIKKSTINDAYLLMKMDKQELTQKYIGGIKNKTKEERIKFLENRYNSLTVYLNNKPIGFCEIDIKDNRGVLSYIFDSDYINKGYCTEACKKIIDICFNELKIEYIVADTISDNKSSIRVLEKLGFKNQNSFIKDNKTFINYIYRR